MVGWCGVPKNVQRIEESVKTKLNVTRIKENQKDERRPETGTTQESI